MASQGPNSAGAGGNVTYYDEWSWNDSGNIAASDNSRTFADRINLFAGPSDFLSASSFGASIPTGATIDGVQVDVERYASTAGFVDSEVYLTSGGYGGVISFPSKTSQEWPTSEQYQTFGGSADLWGATLTPAVVNASGFGFLVNADSASMSLGTIYVDHVRMTVYYTEAASSAASSATMGLMGVG